MKATRNPAVTKEVSQIKVVEVVETVEISPESFTLEFENEETLQFLQSLIEPTSSFSRKRMGMKQETANEFGALYEGIKRLGICRKEFNHVIVRRSY